MREILEIVFGGVFCFGFIHSQMDSAILLLRFAKIGRRTYSSTKSTYLYEVFNHFLSDRAKKKRRKVESSSRHTKIASRLMISKEIKSCDLIKINNFCSRFFSLIWIEWTRIRHCHFHFINGPLYPGFVSKLSVLIW